MYLWHAVNYHTVLTVKSQHLALACDTIAYQPSKFISQTAISEDSSINKL